MKVSLRVFDPGPVIMDVKIYGFVHIIIIWPSLKTGKLFIVGFH
ncbi:protein of unknown function [Candidatus Nitrosotalea okcheonensis]|uniref:Uncharacterized protein n=1 Tax=Candidatus Nitrosotalea okcheonensis TaxID=1903276 RepID=A0A2H1FGH4_9ARCH|nr:protein of unknown function [Candidatus Nitrosotalea okcheonensis]